MNNKFAGILLLIAFCAASIQASAQELTFWNFWDQKLILPVIEKFEKENPGIKIHSEQLNWGNGLDKVIVAMANGRAPDICELGSTWMGKFMAEGALLDVTDMFFDLKPFYLMWEPASFRGRLYGMPWLTGTRALFYNRELFRQAGLDPDKPPTTWQQLYEAAKAIHDPAKGLYGFGMNAGEGHILYKKFMPFVWGNYGKIIDDEDKFVFDSPQTREALDFYLKLRKLSYCEKQDLLDEAFKRGRLGLAISGSWNFARYPIDAPDLDFGVALMPKPSENKGFSTSFLGGEILVIFKTCKHSDAAAKFIRFMTLPENTLPITKEAMTSFPAHVDAYKDPFFSSDKRLKVFIEQTKTAVHPPVCAQWIEVERIINNLVEKAMYGGDVNELFAEAKAEYQRAMSSSADKTPAAPAAVMAHPQSESSNSTQILLLALIGAGTLLNAILLIFLVYEVKKNAA